MFKRVELLEVRAWGELVGVIAHNQSGVATFEYAPTWNKELSPILMPLSPRRIWSFPDLPRATFYGLPPLIADSAPDRFGNTVIAAALAREGMSAHEVRPIDRLAYVGERAMGALTFHPAQSPDSHATPFELAALVQAARSAVQGSLDSSERTDAINELLQVGSSAGGARAKAIIAWNPTTNEIRSGGISAPDGFEEWLLKFDGVGSDTQLGASGQYGRTEYAYSIMARGAGIDMAACHLLEEGGRAHFMTRRFDRPGSTGDRVHMQSLCALAGLDYNLQASHDYASLFLAADELGVDETEQIFRRACFNIVASNNDDHTKNHSFVMDQLGTWSLSPAYDVTYAYNRSNQWLRQHLMSVNGRFSEVRSSDLLTMADQFEVVDAQTILNEVIDAVSAWPKIAQDCGVSTDRVLEVEKRLAEIRTELSAR